MDQRTLYLIFMVTIKPGGRNLIYESTTKTKKMRKFIKHNLYFITATTVLATLIFEITWDLRYFGRIIIAHDGPWLYPSLIISSGLMYLSAHHNRENPRRAAILALIAVGVGVGYYLPKTWAYSLWFSPLVLLIPPLWITRRHRLNCVYLQRQRQHDLPRRGGWGKNGFLWNGLDFRWWY